MATNPWDAFPAVQQPSGPVYGAPDPQQAFRANDDRRADISTQLQVQNAERQAGNDAARIGIEQERLRLAQEAAVRDAEAARQTQQQASAKTATMNSLVDQINRVTDLYNKGISQEGAANLWGALDAIGPQAAQFNSAGQGVADQALSAFRVPGMGAQSDLEARQFASANTPQAGDWDSAIEEKLLNLRRRVDANRQAQGLPPADWTELNPGLVVNVTDDGAQAANADPGTLPPSGPSGEGGGFWDGIGQGVGSIVEGAASIPAIVVDPISTTIGRALGYDNYTSDFASTVREDLGLPKNQDPIGSAIIRSGTAALSGAGLARGLASVASPGAAQNALNQFAATPIRDTAAGAGAGLGGEIGRQIGGVPGQVVGSLAGGIGGYSAASGAARRAFGERVPNALAQAAERQGVDLLPADAGGPVAQAITTGTRASPLSVAPVVRSARNQQAQMGQAASRVANSQGDVTTTDIAGDAVRGAAQRFTKQTSERGARLYDRAGDAARGVRIKPNQTLQRIDEYIARIAENPAATEADRSSLQAFRDNIANGVSVQGLRDARTALSQGVYDGKLRGGAEQTMWKDILGNLSDDIDLGLRGVGRQAAANLFKRADSFWRDRVEHIDEVLQPILGRNRSGEQIVDSIESMARGRSGGGARLSRLLANMSEQEAGNVRATVIDRLGKANPGAQTAEGDAFSAATFLTNWNRMTPQAKASLFSNKELRGNLNDIARLAEGMKASQSMANFSNTGVAVGSNVGAAIGFGAANPGLVALAAGGQYLTGRLMANPRFARALASAAKLPPEQASRRLNDQLTTIAAREPLIAGDARNLQQYLSQALGQSPAGRAVAGEQEQHRRREPVR